jgi:hypothetical protein
LVLGTAGVGVLLFALGGSLLGVTTLLVGRAVQRRRGSGVLLVPGAVTIFVQQAMRPFQDGPPSAPLFYVGFALLVAGAALIILLGRRASDHDAEVT